VYKGTKLAIAFLTWKPLVLDLHNLTHIILHGPSTIECLFCIRLAYVSDVLLAELMVNADVIDVFYVVLDGDISDSIKCVHT